MKPIIYYTACTSCGYKGAGKIKRATPASRDTNIPLYQPPVSHPPTQLAMQPQRPYKRPIDNQRSLDKEQSKRQHFDK